ncbi:MAG TPA: hypothetical protein VHO50_04400 [Bacteroidales bacterium]|nr:hypothetical protein [Bacteroidales bacterium]
MLSLHYISTVARYEARILRRSWFFRLFSIGALFILSMMNLAIFSPIGDEDWDLISIPSSVPLLNLYLLNIGQAVVIIFLAADFLKRDKKIDTNEVLYTRPMSNLEYVLGKSWGILRLFLGLDIIALLIALLMNIISTRMTVDILSYFQYLLIITIPTIVFSLGLSFLLMSAIKNQAVTFLVLLGIAAIDMFFLWHKAGSIFDYMAFGLPVFKSGVIGFDNLYLIINQRLIYFGLGMAMVFATVILFRRLPQSKPHSVLTLILIVIFLVSSVIAGVNTLDLFKKGVKTKESSIATNRKYEDRLFPDVTNAVIEVIHEGKTIKGKASLVFKNNNNEAIESYIFSLNPDLDVTSVSSISGTMKFERNNHIIEVFAQRNLLQGGIDSLYIAYEGGINESYCYPGFSDDIKENPYTIAMVNVSKRQAFLQDNYVLLTPESQWYPVAGLNFYPSNPAKIKIDFTKYVLKVKNENGLIPVSQGQSVNSDNYTIFTPSSPLTGITLAIGNYTADTLQVDSTEYLCYHFPGNDYYKKVLNEIQDTLPTLVSGIMRELETNFSTPYPFSSLYLVEVPVQFHSYPKENTQTRAELQPSMVLLPERLSTIQNAGFSKDFARQKKRMARNNQVITDKELQVRIFNSFIRNTFISGENFRFVEGIAINEPVRYRLGPSFYFFKNNFYSKDYSAINNVMESHLQKVSAPNESGYTVLGNTLSETDLANLIFRDISFSDLLKKNPKGDTIRTTITLKGDWLFNFLRAKAGAEEFKKWFSDYLDRNKFSKIDLLQFNNDIKNEFGFEFYGMLENWYNGKGQPGFIVGDFKTTEVVIDGRLRYQVAFVISNPEPVDGLFNVSFRTEGDGNNNSGQQRIVYSGGMVIVSSSQSRGMETSGISRITTLKPFETKKIGILLDFEPREMVINTLFSKNIPGQIVLPVTEVLKSRGTFRTFEGEERLEYNLNRDNPSEIIVDNEDPGFDPGKKAEPAPLMKILGLKNNMRGMYENMNIYRPPDFWQPIINSDYYGKYILSAVYTASSNVETGKMVSWSTPIKEAGYYNVYAYIGKAINRVTIKGSSQSAEEDQYQEETPRDMHYKVFHDDGIEEITIDFQNTEGGWNNLGKYYISSDTAKVALTNQSQGKVVIGDAIRWVRQD